MTFAHDTTGGTAADTLAPLRGKRVVVADQHPHSRAVLRDTAMLLGAASIDKATNADEVLRQARAHTIDLILCDYQLDGVRDGQQLLEELRQTRQIPRATMFMMITAERTWQKVVAVAEFAPDSYLLKPFTARQLQERICVMVQKKRVFAAAHTLIEAGRAEAALAECGQIRAIHPHHGGDALRLTVEILLGLKRYSEAQVLLELAAAGQALPWAQTGLAQIQHAAGQLEAAEAGLTAVTQQHPEYLRAKDLLARIKQDLGKPAEALAVLEAAGAGGSGNTMRLRLGGALAAQSGDHKKASVLYEKVVARVRNSTLAHAEDFVALADAYIEQGRMNHAERASAEQRRTMRDAPDALLVSKLMEFRRCRRDPAPASQERASQALDAVLAARLALAASAALAGNSALAKSTTSADAENPLTATVEFNIFDACCDGGRIEDAAAIAECLRRRADVTPRILAQIKVFLAQNTPVGSQQAAIIPLDQVLAMLARMAMHGWNDASGQSCRASIRYWDSAAPDDPRLPQARIRLAGVRKQFGMSA